SEVIALTLEDPDSVGFPRLQQALDSRVRFVCQSVYNLDPAELGQFDVVLFLGVLYHLRYPLLAVDKIRNVCRGSVYIETHVSSDPPPVRGWLARWMQTLSGDGGERPEVPVWRFYKGDELNRDKSNWFGPNCRAVIEAFDSAGFNTELRKTWA